MHSLTGSATKSHVGVLTDGQRWQFNLIFKDEIFRTTVSADTPENTTLVLGTCPIFAISNPRSLDDVFCRPLSLDRPNGGDVDCGS
jgi:hypothetical protein